MVRTFQISSARLAAVLGVRQRLADPAHDAAAARGRTHAVVRPLANHAVDRARLQVA